MKWYKIRLSDGNTVDRQGAIEVITKPGDSRGRPGTLLVLNEKGEILAQYNPGKWDGYEQTGGA